MNEHILAFDDVKIRNQRPESTLVSSGGVESGGNRNAFD